MKESEKVINWIRQYFEENGKGCNAVIGISGGCDSTVNAALLAKALGKERVIGVLLPEGVQDDIQDSYDICNYLGIRYVEINIKDAVDGLSKEVGKALNVNPNEYDIYKTNTPARIRMTALYGVSALNNGRVVNTCNLSEDYVGYNTKFGDSAGDFSPLCMYTKTEVKEIAKELGLPEKYYNKIPTDGMSGKSDEEKLGFSYDELDVYIRTGKIDNLAAKEKIDRLHQINMHKLLPMPHYEKK